jgi:putative heme transporter
LTTTATIGQTVTEMLLVLFTLIFFLHGSGGIWQFLRPRGALSLAVLAAYVRATAAVAVVRSTPSVLG